MALQPGFKKFLTLVVAVGIAGGGFYAFKSGMLGHKSQTTIDTGYSAPPSAAPAPSASPQAQPTPASFQPNADTLQSILQNHTVRISVDNPSEPIYGETKDGVPHGFNYEFAQLLFAQPEFNKGGPITIDTHHEVGTYQDVPRQLLVASNGAPAVDIAMDGLTYPDNTPNGVVYTNPYLDNFGYALVVQQGSPIHSAADLDGKTIGILRGDPDVRALVSHQYPNSRLVDVSDEDTDFISKSIDGAVVNAFIYDYPFAVPLLKGTDLKFAVTKLDGSDISYKIGVRSSDTNLLIYLNSAIGRVKQSPAYLDLLRKYFISDQVVTTAATAGEHSYSVKHGDTLNLIASSQLGSGGRYVDIQRRNNLPNPNLILAGQQLVIPSR